MCSGKKVLLIAGGGTLGTYVGEELLRLGASVDVICPEPKESHHERLVFHQSLATEEVLSDLFAKNHYNGIVNFLHYKDVEDYKKVHPFLIKNTDHLIFLSSYRVYANEQHPLTESAPRLTEVLDDEEFMANEKYAVPKARCEDYLRQERAGEPWTIVRPVISFSERRFDLLMNSGRQVISIAEKGKEFLMPLNVKDMKAGLDWAGNSGKLIANLLFKPEALGETFTISSGQNLTWGQVAGIYQRLIGLKVRWCGEDEYLTVRPTLNTEPSQRWAYRYDRRFDRDIDCTKVLKTTGLTTGDFASIEDGIRKELERFRNEKA